MKVLHSALIKEISSFPGIMHQMLDELNCAKKLNLDYEVKIFSIKNHNNEQNSDLVHYYDNKFSSKILSWIEFRKAYYSWLKSKENDVDCYVLRYTTVDPLQALFVKNSKKPVCFIHHTKELDELMLYGIEGKFKSNIDSFFGKLTINWATIIIGVTNEIVEYEKARAKVYNKPSIVKPNGVMITNSELIDRRDLNTPVFLFVSSYFYEWHGLDLLIDAVEVYKKDVKIHLVGTLTDQQYSRIKNNNNFVVHGNLTVEEIERLSEECWLGIGSLALYRNNMKEGSTLKVASYLGMGLPVYAGYIETFPDSFQFYRCGDVNLNDMINFAVSNRIYSKNQIRERSIEYVSKELITKRFYLELLEKLETFS